MYVTVFFGFLLVTCFTNYFQGHTKMHGSIYQLMIRLCKLKNIAEENCIAILWESRRLSHGLCGSPISDTFVKISSEELAENCKHVRFWDNCLKGFQPLLAGLQQSLSFFFVNFKNVSNNHERDYWPEVTVKDVKKVVSELLEIVSVKLHSFVCLTVHISRVWLKQAV